MQKIVIDTNIPLNNAADILVEGNIVCIPETVLAELDSKKGGFEEVNFQARECARILENATIIVSTKQNDMHITELLIDGVYRVDIVALREYTADPNSYGGNDRRIIEVAKALGCTLITNDLHMKFQAMAQGVDVHSRKIVEDVELNFVKEFEVKDPEVFRTLHNTDILSVDKRYEIKNYSYKFTNPDTNQVKLATIHNGFISVLGKETEDKLKKQEAAPMNTEQLLMSKAIQDHLIDIVVVEAKSGSGKTVSAISNAIRLMKLHKDKYEGIVYIRNSVDDIGNRDEEIGFLSGNVEKEAIYLHPLEDTLDFIARKKLDKKNLKPKQLEEKVTEGVDKLRDEYNIQGRIALGLRGRSLHNSIVIIDEAQNISSATMQKIITRIGKDSKLIVIGSQAQIDSAYLNKYNNGLSVLLNECANKNIDTSVNLFAINLHKVLRSPMSEFAEDLYSNG